MKNTRASHRPHCRPPCWSLSLANARPTSSGATPAPFSQVQRDMTCPMLLASPPGVSVNDNARELEEPPSAPTQGQSRAWGSPPGKAFNPWRLGADGNVLLSFCLHPWEVSLRLLGWVRIQHPVTLGCGQFRNAFLSTLLSRSSFLLPGVTLLDKILAQKPLSQTLLSGEPSQEQHRHVSVKRIFRNRD